MTSQRSPVGILIFCTVALFAIAAALGVVVDPRALGLPSGMEWIVGLAVGALASLLILVLAIRAVGAHVREAGTLEAELRGLVEAVPDGVVVVNAHERVLLANRQTERLFGYQQNELLGQSLEVLVRAGARELFAQGARTEVGNGPVGGKSTRATAGAAPEPAREVIGQRRNGDEFPLEARLRPVPTPQGLVYALLLRDPSERRRAEETCRKAEESVQQAEAKFRSIFENAAEGIFQATPEGRFIIANPALARMLGYGTPQELMDKVTDIKRQLFVQPGQRSEIRKLSDRSGVAKGFEVQAYRKDGSKIWLMGNQRAVPDSQGHVLYYEGNFEDITERKRAEDALRESQRAIATLMSNLPGMAYRCANDRDRTMEFVSEGAYDLTGYYPDHLIANHKVAYAQVIHAGDREAVWNEMQTALQAGRPYQVNYRIQTLQGEVKSVWEQGRGAYSAGGRFVLEGFVIDVSERVRAQEKLRQSEERFRQLAENIRGVFWMTDPEMKELLYVNRAYEEIWGRTRQSLFKDPLSRFEAVDEHDRPHVLAAIRKAAEGRYDEEYCVLRHDGSVRWIWDRAFPILDDKGQVSRLAGIAEDVTERKRLAEELRHAQKMEAVGRLAGGIAHDFNNLLTVIVGYCQVLLANLGQQDQWRPCVDEMKKAADRAATLTQQLLAFSRKQVLMPVVLDLNVLVGNMRDMIQRLIGEDVQLGTNFDPSLGRIEADPGQLQQIIMNLIVNARDAMPKGGKLTIATANLDLTEAELRSDPDVRPGPYAMVSVSDTGVGMDAETRAHLFEPFFTTKEVGKGTGLGLATVHGIVKQSRGHIEVQSEPGKGTTFRIYLPRVPTSVEKSNGEAPQGLPSARGQETLLLVEDEELVRRLTRTILLRSGYTVLEARNGREALQIAEQQPGAIHLLVTDVVMPEMNGHELYQRLSRVRPDLRVLFMSGYTDSALLRNGVLEGGFTLVLKPFAPDAFLGHVREVLDKR
jgi:PAS domain S-box-containing protein